MVNLYPFYSQSIDFKHSGSKHANLFISNSFAEADTLIVSINGINRSIIVKANYDTLISLADGCGMLKSYANTLLEPPYYRPHFAESAFYANRYSFSPVWITKSKTTTIAIKDSSYSKQNEIHNDFRVYFFSSTSHGLSQESFGQRFTLSFWKNHKFMIVAKENQTPIDITFKRKHVDTGLIRNYPTQRIYLNKGESIGYNCGVSDASGTLVEAANPCKPIAVILQTGGIQGKEGYFFTHKNQENGIGCSPITARECYDFRGRANLFRGVTHFQSGSYNYSFLVPNENAGYTYMVPSKIKGTINFIEVRALYNNTEVRVNGQLKRILSKNQFYFDSLTALAVIETTEPVTAQYFSKFQSEVRTTLLYPTLPSHPVPLYSNWWVRHPLMPLQDGKKEYSVYIPYGNKNKMVNMEVFMHLGDTLFNAQGNAIAPNYMHSAGKYSSISFALDSGWHTLKCKQSFLAWANYYFYEHPLAKNGVGNIYIDSVTSSNYKIPGTFYTYILHLVNVHHHGEMLGYNPTRRPHSLRVNDVLWRSLGKDSFYTVCQHTNTKLWGRADFYTATKNYWVRNGTDTLTGALQNYQFTDTGMHTLQFYSQKMDTLCDGKLGLYLDSTQFKVWVYGKPKVTLPQDSTVCKGTLLNVQATAEKDTALLWLVNNKLLADKAIQKNIAIDSAKQIIAQLQYLGCSIATDTMQVTVFDSISLQLPKDSLYCHGQNIAIAPTLKGGDSNTYQYQWQNQSANTTYKAVIKKEQTIWLNITDQCGNLNAGRDSHFAKVRLPIKTLLSIDSPWCNNETNTIRAISTGGLGTTYQYQWHNDTTLTDSFYSYNTGLAQTVTCITTDNCSLADTTSITPVPLPPFTISNLQIDTQFCATKPLQIRIDLSNNTRLDSNKIEITNPSGQKKRFIASSFIDTTFTAQEGMWQISINNGCTQSLKDTTFSVTFPRYTFAHQIKDTACLQGTALDYTFTSSQGTQHQYQISNNGQAVATGTATNGINNHVFMPTVGNNALKFKITDGCFADSVTKNIVAYAPIAVQKRADTQVCFGQSIRLKTPVIQGNPNAKVVYQMGNTQLADGVILNILKNETITITANDFCGNSYQDSFKVSVVDKLTNHLNFNPLQGCTPLLVQSAVGNIAGNVSATWAAPAGAITNLQPNFSQGLQQLGRHVFNWSLATQSGKVCADTQIAVTVYPLPDASFSSTPRLPEVDLDNIILSANVPAFKNQWFINDTQASTGSPYQFIAKNAGTLRIKLRAETRQGCMDSSTQDLRVYQTYAAMIPNAFSPNNDNINDVWQPQFNSTTTVTLFIYDRWGAQLFKHQGNDKISWDGRYKNEPLPQGLYNYIAYVTALNGGKHTIYGYIMILR